jgi:hypothetical protein
MILSHTLSTRVNVGVSNALRELANVLDEYDSGSVVAVESTGLLDDEPTVTARVELPISTEPSDADRATVGLSSARVNGDGNLTIALSSVDSLASPPGDVAVEPTDLTVTDDRPSTVTLAVSVPVGSGRSADDSAQGDDAERRDELTAGASTGGRTVGDAASETGTVGDAVRGETSVADASVETGDDVESSHAETTVTDRDVPPFRDRQLLSEVYESCDTFAEMTDELGMDVTPETVRRYMVDHDIHQPNSYETGDDRVDQQAREQAEDQQPPVALPDGIGLPDDVTVDSFIETIKRSNTIYEVKRDVGIPQEDALDMLRELNLIDLVVGRLATEGERDIAREDIVERLREAPATQ